MPIDSARVSKADGSQSLEVPAERGAVLRRAAEEFEQRVFLSTLNDIRNFCEAYGIEEPRSKSRASGIPRVFKFLVTMDVADVERMLDDRMFSGPAQLGPVADAIRGKASDITDRFQEADVACWSRVQCTGRTPDATTTSSPARPGGRRPVSPGRPVRRARRRSPGSARACHGHRPGYAFRIQAAVINGRQQRLPFVERPSSLHALESRPLRRLARCPNNRWTRTRRVAERIAA